MNFLLFTDDKDIPPAPVFAMLTTDGVLCTYQMVNQSPAALNSIPTLLTPAQPLPNDPPKRGTSIAPTPAHVAAPAAPTKPVFNFGGNY